MSATAGPSNSKCSLEGDGLLCNGPLFERRTFSDNDCTLLRARSGKLRINIVCESHKHKFLTFYVSKQLKCCDPFESHKKPIKTGLFEIDLEMSAKSPQKIIPGQKLCGNCVKKIKSLSVSSSLGKSGWGSNIAFP